MEPTAPAFVLLSVASGALDAFRPYWRANPLQLLHKTCNDMLAPRSLDKDINHARDNGHIPTQQSPGYFYLGPAGPSFSLVICRRSRAVQPPHRHQLCLERPTLWLVLADLYARQFRCSDV